MLDERVKALISAALDGALSDLERDELDRQLAESAEARRYRDCLKQIDRVLAGTPAVAAPPDLHEQILAGIDASAHAPRTRRFSFRRPPVLVRYGLAAAAGLLLAVGIYEIRPQLSGLQDSDRLVGTMVPPRKAADTVVVDSYSFELAGVSSSATLERRNGALVLDVVLRSEQTLELDVSVVGGALVFDALAQSTSDFDSFAFSDRTIRASGSGRQEFTVLLNRLTGSDKGTEAQIRLAYAGRGGLIDERVLLPDR